MGLKLQDSANAAVSRVRCWQVQGAVWRTERTRPEVLADACSPVSPSAGIADLTAVLSSLFDEQLEVTHDLSHRIPVFGLNAEQTTEGVAVAQPHRSVALAARPNPNPSAAQRVSAGWGERVRLEDVYRARCAARGEQAAALDPLVLRQVRQIDRATMGEERRRRPFTH
jgi:hypothetical protein